MLKFTKRRNGGMYATIKCEFNVGINGITAIIHRQGLTLESLNQLTKLQIEKLTREAVKNGGENAIYFNDAEDLDFNSSDLATYDQCFDYVKKMFIKE